MKTVRIRFVQDNFPDTVYYIQQEKIFYLELY